MSSVPRLQSQLATNALYVNIAACQSSIFESDGSKASWVVPLGNIAAGQTFRDMGRTVYLPNPTIPNAIAMQSTILRKVQWIPQGAAGYYGVGGAATGDGTGEFYTGYISLGGQTYGGGGAAAAVFARAN